MELRNSVILSAAFLAVFYIGGINKASAADNSFAVFNGATGKCIDVIGYSTVPGTALQQWTCSDTTNQLWTIEVFGYTNVGGEIFKLINVGSGLCLDLAQQSNTNGIRVVQNTCSGSTTQQWQLDPPTQSLLAGGTIVGSANAYRAIRNRYSGLCLDAAASGANGDTVQQWSCGNNANNQAWRLPIF